jgi:hypothetical protein
MNLLKPLDANLLSKDLTVILKTVNLLIRLFPEMKDEFYVVEKNPKDKKELIEICETFSNSEEGFLNSKELEKLFLHFEVKNSEKDIEAFIRFLSHEQEDPTMVSIEDFC